MCLTFRYLFSRNHFLYFISLTQSTDSNGKSSLGGMPSGFICIWEEIRCFKCGWVRNDRFYTECFLTAVLCHLSLNTHGGPALCRALPEVLGTQTQRGHRLFPQRFWNSERNRPQTNRCQWKWGSGHSGGNPWAGPLMEQGILEDPAQNSLPRPRSTHESSKVSYPWHKMISWKSKDWTRVKQARHLGTSIQGGSASAGLDRRLQKRHPTCTRLRRSASLNFAPQAPPFPHPNP